MSTKRLVILVEGDCELKLMNNLVIPELYRRMADKELKSTWSLETCKIVTNRQQNKKGGNINYLYLKNDVIRFAAQGCDVITTFLDFFRLPVSFPGYSVDVNQIEAIEEAVKEDIGFVNDNHHTTFIPYIQKHEYEALLFSDIEGFEYLLDREEDIEKIRNIMELFPNPEDINSGKNTAPSKRLMGVFNYNKTSDGDAILSIIGFDKIYNKCPRFKKWFDQIEEFLLSE